MYLESEQQLRDLYGFAAGRAKDKQLDALEQHSVRFIQLSPFVLLSSYSRLGGVDCSPRGGQPGFIHILDHQRILIPDAKGNNRLDSLVNILETGRVGCLFLIPGVDETLRVNGTAKVSVAAEHLALFSAERNPPKSCIEITVQEVFLHCAKALMRSELWNPEAQIERSVLPSMGKMINDQLKVEGEAESQEKMIERYKQTL
ncbi:pyridoxamine 5'-phosphate oxidase family protein [Oceanospirillum beijerinckii]|uniref:pyridoxamine 5'-phosphate oxidase family protein n=1 Tax=Oceanospirillum beijerinckii TaxID=64976 RepID=UPI00040136A2|nr:pyridoxamine 5'-phosphate oxidase family protein [Oceanospirillum beijerinckii]